MNIAEIIYQFISWFSFLLTGAIIVRVLFSWFAMGGGSVGGPIVRLLDDITEPVLAPLRRIIPSLGMIDISPIIAILLINFISRLILAQITY
jgi:YggT family protein